MVALSVITVTYQRRSLLLRKAASLAEQTLDPGRFEWCVATNGDRAAAATLAELEAPFAVKLVVLPENQPVSAARNAAAELATGEFLLLSDDDVLLPAGCLAAHLAAHGSEPKSADPQLAPRVTTGLRLAAQARSRVVIGDLRLPDDLRGAAADRQQAAEPEPFERTGSFAGRALWINATGANTSLPRAAFEAVGGFDPAFAAYGGEDSDLALRLKRSGARFVRSPEAWAEHVGLVSGDRDKAFAAGRAGVRVWRKHGGLAPALLLGVHPALLALKRAALATPLKRLWGRRTAAYESAYLLGAAAELRNERDDANARPAQVAAGPPAGPEAGSQAATRAATRAATSADTSADTRADTRPGGAADEERR